MPAKRMALLPDVTTWSAERFESTLGDMDVWDAAVREICVRERLSPAHVESGYEASSAAFLLDDSLVLKIFPPTQADTEPIEALVLTHLESDPDIPTPRVHSRDVLEDRHEWPYLIIERISGVPVREAWPHMSPTERHRVGDQCAPLVRAVHDSLTGELESDLTDIGRGWEAVRYDLKRQRHDLLSAIRGGCKELDHLPLAVGIWDQIAEFLQSMPLPRSGSMALIHRDLTEDHLYVQQEGSAWTISGLIDFGDAAVGPANLDWNDLWFHMLARDLEPMKAFLKGYSGSIENQSDLDECFALTVGWLGFLSWLTVLVPTPRLKAMTERSELQKALWPEELIASE